MKSGYRLNNALTTISKAYILGAIEFYQTFEPDEWHEALDLLEHALKRGNEILISNQILIFQNTLLRLIKEYRQNRYILGTVSNNSDSLSFSK